VSSQHHSPEDTEQQARAQLVLLRRGRDLEREPNGFDLQQAQLHGRDRLICKRQQLF
jgi:hypothetical protein